VNVSCLPISFFSDLTSGRMSLRDWAEIGAEAGLDGIDLSIIFLKNHTPVYLRQVEKDFQAVGLPVVMITTYPDFCHPDAVQRERELAYLRHDIAMASDLRTPYLRIVAGQAHPDIKEHDAFDWVLDGFKRAADFAQAFDVQLVYENHSKPGAWAYTDFSHSTERFLKIAAALLEYETIEGKHVHEILELGEIRSPITKDVPPEDTDEEEGDEQSQEETAKDDDVGGIEPGSEPAGVPA